MAPNGLAPSAAGCAWPAGSTSWSQNAWYPGWMEDHHRVALEGQLRLASSMTSPPSTGWPSSASMVERPDRWSCRRARATAAGPPQRLEREAMASLQAHLARWPFPCSSFEKHHRRSARTIRGLSCPLWCCRAREPAFLPIGRRPNRFRGVWRSSRRGLPAGSAATRCASRLTGLGAWLGGLAPGPGCSLQQPIPRRAQRNAIHAAPPSPSCGDESQRPRPGCSTIRVRPPPAFPRLTRPAATNWWATEFSPRKFSPSWRSGRFGGGGGSGRKLLNLRSSHGG